MVIIRFLKQQNWWYGTACIILFLLFHYGYLLNFPFACTLEWMLITATAFLICYSLKFAGKYNNLFIDRLKLFFYFLYFTLLFCSFKTQYYYLYDLIDFLYLWIIFYLYFYSIMVFYKREYGLKDSISKVFYWLIIIVVQSFFFLYIEFKIETQRRAHLEWEKENNKSPEEWKRLAEEAKQAALKAKDMEAQKQLRPDTIKKNTKDTISSKKITPTMKNDFGDPH